MRQKDLHDLYRGLKRELVLQHRRQVRQVRHALENGVALRFGECFSVIGDELKEELEQRVCVDHQTLLLQQREEEREILLVNELQERGNLQGQLERREERVEQLGARVARDGILGQQRTRDQPNNETANTAPTRSPCAARAPRSTRRG